MLKYPFESMPTRNIGLEEIGETRSDSGVAGALAEYFDFDEHGTDLRTEILAGLTTFLTMSYIVVVNPAILSAAIQPEGIGPDRTFQMLAVVTIIAAATATLVMGLYARRPFGQAPGLGLNAFFAFTVVLGLGIAAGIVSYPIVKLAAGEVDDTRPGHWVLAAAFVVYFFVRTGGVLQSV